MVTTVGRSAVAGTAEGMHGFPVALTSFVGRAQAVTEIADRLSQRRLVTVTGPGGAGKTRLAGEVARRVVGRFADGVWLAELAAVRDPGQVAAVVAAALGVRDLPAVAPADALADALARRQLLLVLDNCEQVIGAAAELCGRLLLGADDVRVLATSREPLRIAGEARYRLGQLSLPEPGGPPAAAECEAVTLFADRAAQADPGFTLDETTRAAVARLVARLDGMPLAIELAAARVDALGVAQLLERIDDRFELLTDGDRLAEQRQRSLAATVHWSYCLLDDFEQRVFRAVSAFPGPFTLEGAEAVAGAGARRAVLRLTDCSLLVPPRVDPDGRTRYAMLETLRTYAAGLLAGAGEDGEAAAALAGYAVKLAAEASLGLQTGTTEVASLRHLDAEDATMSRALAWAMDHDPGTALRLALALQPWWQVRGRLAGNARLLAAAAEYAAPGSDEWYAARMRLGQAALLSGRAAAALEHFTAVRDALEEAIRPASPWRAVILSLCLDGRSGTLSAMGRVAEAVDDGRRALELARQTGQPGLEALALACLSVATWHGGDRAGAFRLARQAQQLPGDVAGALQRGVSQLITMVLAEAGDLAAAEQAGTAGLARCREAGDLTALAGQLWSRVILDLRAHRTGDAAEHVREQLKIATQTGVRAHAAGRPGFLRPPVRGHRPPRRGGHGVGGDVCARRARAAPDPAVERGPPGRSAAQSPGAARGGRDTGGRAAGRRHEPGHRRRVRPAARRGRVGAVRHSRVATAYHGRIGRGAGPGRAHPSGTGTGDPGRAGPHRRADRSPAVYHRAHGELPPGPHPGQDRLPPPRRPHPARPEFRLGLTQSPGHPCG